MSGLSEVQRTAYLDAIGLVRWLPRTQLTAAAPSPDWVFEQPPADLPSASSPQADVSRPRVEAPAPAARPAKPAPSGRGARPDISALTGLDDKPQPKAVAPKPVAAPAPSEPQVKAAATSEIPNFKLAYLVCGEYLLIDSLPPHSREGFSRAHQQLAQNILRALGKASELGSASIVTWPMLTSSSLDQSGAIAAQAVKRKLEVTVRTHELKRALILGQDAARWVVPQEAELDTLRGHKLRHYGLELVVSSSLTQLLHLPSEKAQLWQDIQPLLTTA